MKCNFAYLLGRSTLPLMIRREEIDQKAQQFEISPSNVERDYVFGWLLFGIFTVSGLKDRLFLKGGNALRKGYFENTRFSADLDFGMHGDIPDVQLLGEINRVCEFVHDKAGVDFVIGENIVKEKFAATDTPLPGLKVYEARVYFKDFYGKSGHVRIRISMDITRFDKVLLPLQSRVLIHPYSDAAELACNVPCMKLEEIIATKLKCLMQRQHAPDLFDYAYSIAQLGGSLNRAEVVQAIIEKTIFSRNPFVLKSILVRTAFDYFREEWVKSVICAKQILIQAEDAIAAFVADVEALFLEYPDNGFAQFVYFPAQQRVPIMQAARTQTLLKIRYKGEERLVEPYSLKYQTRRDGVEREYFFTYKVSGGATEPGIRTFTADRMEAIENTDRKFEPRHAIELSKAGEMPENRYLFDPNKPIWAPRARLGIGRQRPRLKYTYRCTSCGKQVTKTTQSATIGPHKSPGGYACSSRRGYFVGSRYS
jgi:predicted nucleotidyltransferase component of viral defense system